jgi:hypothetical protein
MSNKEKEIEKKLVDVYEWAKGKIQGGAEPPWAWYQYMKLIETLEAILSAKKATVTRENSQQSDQHSGSFLRLVDSKSQPDTFPPRPNTEKPQMPM